MTEYEANLDAEMKAAAERALMALTAIQAEHKATGRWGGEIACPCCTKRLRWAMAGKQKHVQARCETNGCVEFTQ